MITYTRARQIARTPEEVFDFVTDQSNLPTWSPEVVRSEVGGGGEIEVGSVLRQVRMNKGKEMTTEVEVVAHERPRLHTVATRVFSVDATFDFTFRDEDGVTRAQMKATVEGRRFGVFLEKTMARMMEAADALAMTRLKEVLEGTGD
jgi:uncharacterized protein YndB with AHSA1/START domain